MNDTESSIVNSFGANGFSSITSIQAKAIPVLARKKSCLLVAPTGSGKTEASVIPIFYFLSRNEQRTRSIKCIYVTPLRALNNDVLRRIISYAKNYKLDVRIRHGDTSQKERRRILDNPPDILITTPESLAVILTSSKYVLALNQLQWVILDEIHELINNERGAHLSLSLERLQSCSNEKMIRVGLSATLANLDEAAHFIGGEYPSSIIVDNTIRNYDIEIKVVPGSMNSAADFVIDYLRRIKSVRTVLLFANTRDEAEYLGTILKKQHEIPVDVHHGSLSREMREETEHRLRSGIRGIVVCTSSLELGLDIGSVDLVIHYGSPKQVSKLVQRIGRSRHNSANSAKGLIIVNNLDDELESIAILKRMRSHSVEIQQPHYRALDVLAHHIVGIALSSKGSHNTSDVFKILTQSYAFKEISFFDFLECINLLESNKLIFCNQDKSEFSRRIKSYKYYFDNVSTIPYVLKFDVIDILRKRKVGSLDQQFVGEYGERGNVFVLKGNQWRIINVDDLKMQVNVEQILGSQINVPHWIGEMIPVDVETAIEVGRLRHKAISPHFTSISDHSKSLENLKIIPDGNNIVIESVTRLNTIVIHSTFGNKVNNTLSSLFSTIISSQIGYLIETKADPYRISLMSVARIGKKHIEKVLTDQYDVESILIASFKGTYNLNWKVWNVAKKFGIVSKEAIYDKKIARLIYERYSKTPLSKESIRELLHDKFDIQSTEKLLDKVKFGKIALHWIEEQEFSSLAEPIIQHQTRTLHSPMNIEQGLIDLVKERLLKTKHRLICIRCGKWERLLETREVGETISCKLCGSRLITATFASDYDLSKIIVQKLGGIKITSDENHKFDRAWKAASLINNFGKQAILVMSGYGIGVDTAARILRNNTDDEQIFRTIYDAERQYIMTRGFWKNE